MNPLFIYSRYSSSRLPGKALLPFGKSTLLGTVIDNLGPLEGSFPRILLTSTEKSDDPLVELADRMGIRFYRGDLQNVGLRTLGAIEKFGVSSFARVNGDCPVQKCELLREGFHHITEGRFDLVSNIHPRSFPYGISVEIIKGSVFKSNVPHFNKFHKEHITSYFYDKYEAFKIKSLVSGSNWCSDDIRLTVDDEQTYKGMKKLFDKVPDLSSRPLKEIAEQYKAIQLHD